MPSRSNPDFAKIRQDFPMLKSKMHGKPLVYLDTGATAQKPQAVIDAIYNFYQFRYGTVHRAVYELCAFATQEYETTRSKVGKLLNAAKIEEIIYTRGTTESINLVAHSFGKAFINPGDEILISNIEHHSNIVPWQMVCEDRKAKLSIIPVNDKAEIILDKYEKMLSPKTKMVAIGHIANSTGTIHPVKQMIAMAHKAGAKVLIDGAQSVPHIVVDVQDLDADFYAFSGHKFYGPTGIGILYGKEELLNALPPYQCGGDMVDKVTFEKTYYNVLPLKFEAGTPMVAEVIGLGAAIDYVQGIGLDAIQKRDHELMEHATKLIKEINGVRIIGEAKHKGALLSFIVDGIHHLDIGTMLDMRGIAIRTGQLCAHPTMARFGVTGVCRASFAFYNTIEEVNYFIDSLKDVIKILK